MHRHKNLSLLDFKSRVLSSDAPSLSDFPYRCVKRRTLSACSLASPLVGEAAFQYEQRLANIRKAGEGKRNVCRLFTPLPIFLTLKNKILSC